MNRAMDKRTWLIGGTATAVVIAAVAWFFLISPVFSDTDSLGAQTTQAEQQKKAAQDQLTALQKQRAQLPKMRSALAQALAALPIENGIPAFTNQVNAQAQDYGVTIDNLTVGSIAPVNVAGAGGAPAPADAGTTSTTPANSATTAPAAPTNAGTTGQSTGGLMSIPISLGATGTASNLMKLVHAIQVAGPRRALLTNLQLLTGPAVNDCKLQLQVTLFATPSDPAQRTHVAKLLTSK
jgi:hypothetical protein